MSTTTSAEEALSKARAIAARLSGQTTTTTTTDAGKRKRWGVMPEAAGGGGAAAANGGVAGDSSSSPSKRPKEGDAVDAVQKRIWIDTTEEKPYTHFVSFLKPRLVTLVDSLNSRRSSGNQNEQQQEQQSHNGSIISMKLEGRGASDKPPVPGMPEQPLHVLLSGPTADAVTQAAIEIDKLLLEAEQAPLEGHAPPDKTDQSRALTTLSSTKTSSLSSSGGSYRPASVAQLIGQANLPPELLDATSEHALLQEDIHVPHGVVGYIIGRGGENITKLQARYGCKIQIQKESDLQPGQTQRVITLKASTQAAIDECRTEVERMVQEQRSRLSGSSGGGGNGGGGAATAASKKGTTSKVEDAIALGHAHVQVQVPEEDVGLVIGKQGSTIRSIQERTGASIQVPQQATTVVSTDDNSNSKAAATRLVDITHPTQQGAQDAKQEIENILKSKQSFKSQGPQASVQISIPDKDVGLCIGRQGCVIRQLQNSTNTRIQIPSQCIPGEMYRVATITGTQEGCNQAQQMIQQIIVQQSSAPVMSGLQHQGGGGQQQYYAQQQDSSQQAYSAEWAAYHAAQAAAQQQQQQQYASAVAQPAPAPAAAAASSGQTAADAYYEQFFRYAYYYGEDAARQYYGAWSPPVGTPNPYGTNPAGIQPAPAPAPAATTTAASQAPVGASGPAPSAPSDAQARETGRRKVSNLPAWMTKS